MAQIMVTRKSYSRKDGTRVRGTTYYTEERGKSGKTPERERWYEHNIEMNWHKGDSAETRRGNAIKAHKGNELVTAKALQALANVTTDQDTKRLAKIDADYFFHKHE